MLSTQRFLWAPDSVLCGSHDQKLAYNPHIQ